MAPPYELTFAIRKLAINAGAWTDVAGLATLPIGCDSIIIYNNSLVAVLLRTDPNNSDSEIEIASGQAFEIGSTGRRPLANFRFPVGCPPACALLSTSGNQTMIIESLQ